ncbi:LysR family transcriptional regulator [Vibrio sp. WXL103]|uniref:LysR family transcriptional regulator n=1 Tax=unclassified Vibrio TaxID=2614977 RepID=UPI003EC90D63
MLDKSNIKKWDLNLLRIFVVVYKTRNLKRAAHLVGLSAPSLSLKLTKLKALVKDELFFKTVSGFEPTEMSHKLYVEVEPLLSRLDSVFEEVKGFDPAEITRPIVLDLGQHFAPWLPLGIHQFVSDSCPNSYLIADYFTRNTVERLRRSEVELGVQFDQTDVPKDIISILVGEVEGCFLVRDDHPLTKPIQYVEEVLPYGFAMYEQNITSVGSRGLFIEALDRAELGYDIKFKSPSALTVHEIIRSSNYVLPTIQQPKEAVPSGLRMLPLHDKRFNRKFPVNAYLYQENRHSEKCKWLINKIKALLAVQSK